MLRDDKNGDDEDDDENDHDIVFTSCDRAND